MFKDLMKRLFDMVMASVGLVVCAPILLTAALLVKCSSRGPILFRQQRIGLRFRPFRILKFRTMVANGRGCLITSADDPRITTVGRILRKVKVDELPQLINVLRGEMSFVGPRPEVPRYVEMYRDDYQQLLQVRPGITDMASVLFRDEQLLLAPADDPEDYYVNVVLPEKIALGKLYLEKASFATDLYLICQTLLRIASPSHRTSDSIQKSNEQTSCHL